MAVLKEAQIKQKAGRELKRQEAVKKKAELLADKKYWEEHKKEWEELKKDNRIPRIFDFEDTANFFEIIKLFKDEDGNVLETDFKEFMKHEEEIKTQVKENQKDIFYENLLGEETEYIVEDGKNGLIRNEKKGADISKAISNQNMTIAQHFNRYTPKYNFQVCTCCGKPKRLRDFNSGWNLLWANRIDSTGMYHAPWCIECSQKLFDYFYENKTERDPQLAMEMFCCATNNYWDAEIFKTARISTEKQDRYKHLVGTYMQLLSIKKETYGKSFWDSPLMQGKQQAITNVEEYKNVTPYDWQKEDAQNRNIVLKMIGYDPFSYETEENKKVLYKDLLGILDIGMENDVVKLQSAIQIVNSYFRVRLMDRQYAEMQKELQDKDNKVSFKDLNELAKLKKTELDAITSFARDNGFSERYASAKAKGENTLTGIMNKMGTQKYEKAVLNRYDVETSETIQQAANASFQAIFKQLSLGETDVWKICQEQLEELKKIRKENEDQKEKVRKLHCTISELELKEKAREKGIEVENND